MSACDYRENGECWTCGCCDDVSCCDDTDRCTPLRQAEQYCGTVIGFQNGEPVLCGAIESIHGDGLGMVRGHAFDAQQMTPTEDAS